MIIACPACGTKYVVPDDALGMEGRTVRCAKCKHSWFQDGPAMDLPPPLAADTDLPDMDEEEQSSVVPAPATPRPEPAGEAPPREPARERRPAPPPVVPEATPEINARDTPSLPDAAVTPPPFYRASDKAAASPQSNRGGAANRREEEPEHSSFDYGPPFRPRRNRLRLLTVAAASFAALAFLAILVMQVWGLPSWLPGSQPLFAAEEPDLAMSFPEDRQQTRTLPTGGEFLAISGTIANTGRETRSVPPVLLVLRDERNRVVYSQEIAPPRPILAPGERAEVTEAIADIPQSAVAAEFGWAPR